MNTTTLLTNGPAQPWVSVSPSATSSGTPTSTKQNGMEPWERVEQTIAFMMDNLNRPLQVATLAFMAHVSPSHYFALFKRRTGCAPMDYFTRLRMKHACRLLDTTTSSVKEIAARLGYEDPFYFSRVFKSVQGSAPSDYRKLNNGSRSAQAGAETSSRQNGKARTAQMTDCARTISLPAPQ